jgi:RPA family protein
MLRRCLRSWGGKMREPAWRVFAAEYNSSKHYIKATEPKTPSYIITPLGAKISRVFIVGVLTEVRLITDEIVKARIADQTGAFYLLAGKFNPDSRQLLETVKVPQFVAVVGKVNVYNPREDLMYVSVVPERVKVVNELLRDYWVFDTARRLKIRIDAMNEALKMREPSVNELTSLGFSRKLSEGIVLALQYYKKINVERYMDMLKDALKHLLPEYRAMGYELPSIEEEEEVEDESNEDTDRVLQLISELDKDGKGASYEDLLEKSGLDEERLDEVLLSLQEKGEIYEPYLGKFKRI